MSHGRYSPTALKAIDHSIDNYRYRTCPPSTRTRSQARLHTRRTSSSPSSPPQSRTGTFSPRPGPRTTLRETRRLHRARLKLRRYIVSDAWMKDDPHNALPEPTPQQVEHLGRLSPLGEILSLPPPVPGSWMSEMRMRRRRERKSEGRRRKRGEGMGDVWTYFREGDEVGVLPGEESWWEEDVQVLRAVWEEWRVWQKFEDGKTGGRVFGGVWRDMVRDMGWTGEGEVVRWMYEEKSRWEGRVMDPVCVGVVRSVWKFGIP